jgi:hypothetical protein
MMSHSVATAWNVTRFVRISRLWGILPGSFGCPVGRKRNFFQPRQQNSDGHLPTTNVGVSITSLSKMLFRGNLLRAVFEFTFKTIDNSYFFKESNIGSWYFISLCRKLSLNVRSMSSCCSM